jgi:hypothetical protein
MRIAIGKCSLMVTLFLLACPLTSAGDGKEFFNGHDLTGWEGLIEQYWSVKDKAIVGGSGKPIPFNTFLCSKKKYGDFELSFEVELVEPGGKSGVFSRNSGVQIRSEIFDRKHFAVRGPQCDIGQHYWGSLYGEHFSPDGKKAEGMMQAANKEVLDRALKKEGFNSYAIRCIGKHVTIKINGRTTVDGDFPRMPDTGIIAFQLHSGGPFTATFRNIQFKDLSSGTK